MRVDGSLFVLCFVVLRFRGFALSFRASEAAAFGRRLATRNLSSSLVFAFAVLSAAVIPSRIALRRDARRGISLRRAILASNGAPCAAC
jgi:hypothetical protein